MADRAPARAPGSAAAENEPMPRVPRQAPPKRPPPPGGNAIASQAPSKPTVEAKPAKAAPKVDGKASKKPPGKPAAKPAKPRAPAVPPLPAQAPPLVTRPLETPANLQSARGAKVARFAQRVTAAKVRVETAVGVAQARVLQIAMQRIGQVDGAYDEHERAIGKDASDTLTALETLRKTTKASIEEVRSTRRAAVATTHETQAARTTKLVETKTEAARKGTGGRADEVEAYAETNAKHVETTTAKNIAKANEIAKTKGDFYRNGPRGDDIVEMANELAKEMTENFAERGKETADSIREDAEPVVRELRKMRDDLTKEYAKHGTSTKQAVDKAKHEADSGLDKLASDALPHIDEGIDAPVGQVAVMQRNALGQMTKLHGRIVLGLHAAALKLVGALGRGGQDRVDDIERAGRNVLGRREELERGDRDDLDEALTAHELTVDRGADGYALEIDLAATRGLGELDKSIDVGLTAGTQLGDSVKAGFAELVQKTRGPIEKAVVPVTREADKLVASSSKTMVKANDELEKRYDQSLEKLDTELAPKVTKAKQQIDDKVKACLPTQDEDLAKLGTTIDSKAKELMEEGRVARFFKAVGGFLWGVLSAVVGFIAGVLWAIVKFLIGLVLLIVALVVLLVVLVVALVVLFVVLAVLLGAELALMIVLIIGLVVIAVIAIVAIVAIVVGIVMTVVSIIVGIWRAFTEKNLSAFDRGFLVGESLTDLLLLLLPFKAKIPGLRGIKFPGWMPSFLVGEHPAVPEPGAPKLPVPELPPVSELPRTEAPVIEPPPVSELPRTEAPVVETPKVEAPVVETPKVEAPPVEKPPAPEKPVEGPAEKPAEKPVEKPKEPVEEQPTEEPPPKSAKDAQEAAAEEAAIEAEAAQEKVPPEEAENWEQVQKLLGPPPKKLGKRPPKGYRIYYRGGRRFLRRIDADPKKFVQLTVDEHGNFSLPKASQRISVPGKLAENLGARPLSAAGAVEPHQAHHLIPDEVVRKNPLLQLAREKAGYNLDRASNGVYLPETAAARDATPASKGLPLHRGSHPTYSQLADDLANKELADLIEAYGSADKIPPDELGKAVTRVEGKMRDIINKWITLYGDKLK